MVKVVNSRAMRQSQPLGQLWARFYRAGWHAEKQHASLLEARAVTGASSNNAIMGFRGQINHSMVAVADADARHKRSLNTGGPGFNICFAAINRVTAAPIFSVTRRERPVRRLGPL